MSGGEEVARLTGHVEELRQLLEEARAQAARERGELEAAARKLQDELNDTLEDRYQLQVRRTGTLFAQNLDCLVS